MRTAILLGIYSLLIVLAAMAGGWLPVVLRMTHQRTHLMMSGVAGLMLGVGLFHLLPHSYAETGSLDRSIWWLMVGLLAMFLLIRTFQFHQHDIGEPKVQQSHSRTAEPPAAGGKPEHSRVGVPSHRLNWLGMAVGLGVHSLIDGMALAAAVTTDAVHGENSLWLGAGTFLAILLHKPLDAVSITSLTAAEGWPTSRQQAANLGVALMCPLGVALFSLSLVPLGGASHSVVGCALAFSAGVFLCISLGDLMPELQFHVHDRFNFSAALLAGVALAYGIHLLEPEHAHSSEKGDTLHETGHSRSSVQPSRSEDGPLSPGIPGTGRRRHGLSHPSGRSQQPPFRRGLSGGTG